LLDEIIKGCRKKHRESQKALYEKYYAYGMSIALRYADSREQGVAILNDSFMKVFEHINKFDTNRPFNPWFRRIVINTAIDYFNRNKKLEWANYDITDNEIAEEESITTSMAYQEIIGLIQQLTPSYRTVFNLYVIEGFTHEEIAGKLGIAVGTSKSNLAKAKRNLREILEKHLT